MPCSTPLLWCNCRCNCFEMEGGKKSCRHGNTPDSYLNCSVLASSGASLQLQFPESYFIFSPVCIAAGCYQRSSLCFVASFVILLFLTKVVLSKTAHCWRGIYSELKLVCLRYCPDTFKGRIFYMYSVWLHSKTRWKACCNGKGWDVMYCTWWIAHFLTASFWKHSQFCTKCTVQTKNYSIIKVVS